MREKMKKLYILGVSLISAFVLVSMTFGGIFSSEAIESPLFSANAQVDQNVYFADGFETIPKEQNLDSYVDIIAEVDPDFASNLEGLSVSEIVNIENRLNQVGLSQAAELLAIGSETTCLNPCQWNWVFLVLGGLTVGAAVLQWLQNHDLSLLEGLIGLDALVIMGWAFQQIWNSLTPEQQQQIIDAAGEIWDNIVGAFSTTQQESYTAAQAQSYGNVFASVISGDIILPGI